MINNRFFNLNIIAGGKIRYLKTKEYKKLSNEIRKQLYFKYVDLISNEEKYLKKLILLLKWNFEIRKNTQELSSERNLYFFN